MSQHEKVEEVPSTIIFTGLVPNKKLEQKPEKEELLNEEQKELEELPEQKRKESES